ncbi:MAG: hypothetical protein FGM24_10930, partial [Candidatus Kapabacteria bacterium]|nr:hypothetical protein [Candidatus Kapabacteria bacterium]
MNAPTTIMRYIVLALVGILLTGQAMSQKAQRIRGIQIIGPGERGKGVALLAPPNMVNNYTLVLPGVQGATGQVLARGAGDFLTWVSPNDQSWTLLGNTGTDSTLHFIGTTASTADAPLIFKTDGVERMRITGAAGWVGIGTNNPTALLDVNGTFRAGGNATLGGTLSVTGTTTLTTLNGTARVAVPSGFDRIVLASSDGVLDEASISSVVAAGIAGNAWALAGNTGYSASGTLGNAPTGSFLGSTTALPLNIVTNNAIRMIVSTDGAMSTQRDITVNGVTVGRGTGSDASNTVLGSGAMSISGGSSNTAIGYQALQGPGLGVANVAVGNSAMQNAGGITMASNTAVGVSALSVTQGSEHVALGSGSLQNLSNSNAQSVVAVGAYAGSQSGVNPIGNNLTNASYSVYLGGYSRPLANNGTYENVLGYDAVGNGNYTTTIGNTQQVSTHNRGHLNL